MVRIKELYDVIIQAVPPSFTPCIDKRQSLQIQYVISKHFYFNVLNQTV